MKNNPDLANINKSVLSLEQYILKENYRGYDPFDALCSPVFKLPLLKKNKLIRFGFQQVLKRLPVNFRPELKIREGLNPVTLGLCVQAFSYLTKIFPEKEEFYKEEIDKCISLLIDLRSKGYNGYCWGYDFDWQARYATIPAYTPTVVATGFITNSFFINYKLCNNEKAIEICSKAVPFILNDLNRTYEGDTFCFSYSPLDNQMVYNATLKGVRVLIQAYEFLNRTSGSSAETEKLLLEAERSVKFVIQDQNPDGSWSYSKGDARIWVDNFHTGYVLDILKDFIKITGKEEYSSYLKKGVKFYFENFFIEEKIPKYYNNSLYPIDSTSAAQSIITSLKFQKPGLAYNVAKWMIENMQSEKGFFYFQKKKFYTNKISYMRWSNAWMFAALANLLWKIKDIDDLV